MSKLKTKRIEILCSYPGHQKYFSDLEWRNTCQSYCNQSSKLVCANCEGDITINDKAEQECKSCEKTQENINHEP